MTAGFQTNLLTGLATDLQTGSIGTWSTAGVYTPTQTGIVLDVVPQTPDRIITLTDYPVSDDVSGPDSVVGIQVRCRWGGADPRLVKDLADLIFQRWQNMCNVTLTGGVYVVQCLRQSGPVSLGQDANLRWSNSTNYYLKVGNPATNRR